MEEELKIIIKQNYINLYLLEAVLIRQGVDKETIAKLIKNGEKESNRCLKELFNEK